MDGLSVRSDTVRGRLKQNVDPIFDIVDENGVNWQLPLTLDDSIVQSLLSASKPSSFGDLKKRATVIDPSVRLAQEIVLKSLQCRTGLLNKIRGNIEEAWGRCIRLDPYKINIYGPGGKFKKHVDTSRGDGHLGSLVIQFHHSYVGGELFVLGDDGSYSSSRLEAAALPVDDEAQAAAIELQARVSIVNEGGTRPWWIAFFSDQIHEIFPVYRGTRLTLCFHVWLDQPRDLLMNPTGFVASESEEFEDELVSAIEAAQQEEKCIAIFFLSHKYTHFNNHNLKGKDMALFRFLRSKYVAKFCKFKMTVTSEWEGEEFVESLNCDTFGYDDKDSHILFDCFDLSKYMTGSTDGRYTGNEDSPGTEQYENSAIVIHIGWRSEGEYFPVKRIPGSDLTLAIDDVDDVANSVDDLELSSQLFEDPEPSRKRKAGEDEVECIEL